MDQRLQTALAVWEYPKNNASNLFGDWDMLCCLSVRKRAIGPKDVAGNAGKIYFRLNSSSGHCEAIPQEQFRAIANDVFDSTATFIRSE